VRRTSPFFLSFRVGFSPRGICFSDFFSSLFSRASRGQIEVGLQPREDQEGSGDAPLFASATACFRDAPGFRHEPVLESFC